MAVNEHTPLIKNQPDLLSLPLLCKAFGWRRITLISAHFHALQGFGLDSFKAAALLLYTSYGVHAADMQMFIAIGLIPWSLKPMLGLGSDVLPICGYRKTPQSIMVALLGVAACLLVAFGSQKSMSVKAFLLCNFAIHLAIATVSILMQGMMSGMAQKETTNTSVRSQLLEFVWPLSYLMAFLGTISAGVLAAFDMTRLNYLVVLACILSVAVPASLNFFCEEPVQPHQLVEIRNTFTEHWQIPAVSAAILLCNLAMSLVTLSCSSFAGAAVSMLGSLTIAFLGLALLPDQLGKMIFFLIFAGMSRYQLQGAEMYFLSDSVQEYQDGPHFSKSFISGAWFGTDVIAISFGMYLGSRLGKGWTYRGFCVAVSSLMMLLSMPGVLFYLRWNTALGVPDPLMAVLAKACVGVGNGMQAIGLFVAFTFLCPDTMEATVYGLLMGTFNLADGQASGSLVLHMLGVNPKGSPGESSQFENMWVAAACQPILCFAVTVLLQRCLPAEEMFHSLVFENSSSIPASSLEAGDKLDETPSKAPEG